MFKFSNVFSYLVLIFSYLCAFLFFGSLVLIVVSLFALTIQALVFVFTYCSFFVFLLALGSTFFLCIFAILNIFDF